MSSDAQRPASRHRFGITLIVVIAILALLGGIGAAVSLTQGPRISSVQSDPQGAITASGSRVVITANQALAALTAKDVKITPDAPHTVDASGRSVGIRFTQPLDDATKYTVTIANARAAGGGPSASMTTTFTTPKADMLILVRHPDGSDEDVIFRTDMSGKNPVEVYKHAKIDDFRVQGDTVVVSVIEDGVAALYRTTREGGKATKLTLPGEGFITGLQLSDRGGYVGYVYSDKNLSATSGRASVLFTQKIRGGTPAPLKMQDKTTGKDGEVSVGQWRFVPDASAFLVIDFPGDLLLGDATGGQPTSLGTAITIDGITRGTYRAIVQRPSALVTVDLRTGKDTPLKTPERPGTIDTVIPLAGDDLLWPYTLRDSSGIPTGRTYIVTSGTEQKELFSTSLKDPILSACASPSGKYIALTVAPDIVSNPYDGYPQPLPQTMQTTIINARDGSNVVSLRGFDVSWCSVGPW